MRQRRGISVLEVLMASVIAAVLGFSIVVLVYQGNHEAMVSEDFMLAEAVAQRALAEAMSLPWEALEEKLPLTIELGGVPAEDADLARIHEEYRRNLEGPEAPRGQLVISERRPGLLAYTLDLHWAVKSGARHERHYGLVRLRCRKDLAITANHPLLLPGPRPGSPGGLP